MRTARDLLDDLESAGLTLATQGGKLLVSPAGALTPDLSRQIREGKADLMRALAVRQAVEDARPQLVEELDRAGLAVALVEVAVLTWPDGTAAVLDPAVLAWMEELNRPKAKGKRP